jgi:hypothetical protein
MGKFEQEASRKVLAGQMILNKTVFTFVDYFLWPIRIVKYWYRQREIRKNIWKKP